MSQRNVVIMLAVGFVLGNGPRHAVADLVVNGSFRGSGGGGGFDGWTVASAIPGASTTLNTDDYGITPNPAHVAPGETYAAFFGPMSPTSSYTAAPAPGPYTLSQNFAPQDFQGLLGQTVTLSFRLMVEGVAAPTEGLTGFQVAWFGTALEPASPPRHFGFAALNGLDYITPDSPGLTQGVWDALPYTLSFTETLTQADLDFQGPSLQFSFLNDKGFFYLDSVQAAVAPEPPTLPAVLIGAILIALAARCRVLRARSA